MLRWTLGSSFKMGANSLQGSDGGGGRVKEKSVRAGSASFKARFASLPYGGGLCDVGVAGESEQVDREVTDAGHHAWAVAGAYLGQVLTPGDIADPSLHYGWLMLRSRC